MSSSRNNTNISTNTGSNANNNDRHHRGRSGQNRNSNGNSNRHHRNNRSNHDKSPLQDHSKEWLAAIQHATRCLQDQSPTMDDLNECMNYLNALEARLLVKERKWHFPPDMLPPAMLRNGGSDGAVQQQQQPTPLSNNTTLNGQPPSASMVVTPGSSSTTKTNNRYALFEDDEDDDDDDDDDDEDDESTMVATDIDEAGDQITFHPPQNSNDAATTATVKTKEPYVAGMDMRRIMIRIYNAESDVFAKQAYICRKQYPHPEWMKGANMYSHCLHKIHSALMLADSEISKWMSYTYKMNSGQRQHRFNSHHHRHQNQSMYTSTIIQLLTEDAEIVEIAVSSMTSNREEFMSAAKQLEGKILRKLQPQWRTRDEVKGKMGVERWTNNPNPKHDFSKMRLEFETELNDIRKALRFLSSPELDTTNIENESKLLREKIQMGGEPPPEPQPEPQPDLPPQYGISSYNGDEPQLLTGLGTASIQDNTGTQHQYQNNIGGPYDPSSSPTANGFDPQSQAQEQYLQQQRYNGLRPTDYSRRVDIQLYPDPSIYEWIFTGSYGVTEFFEKYFDHCDDVIKLDWYFTTATVKTSMNHPTQGHTQLFAARVDPDMYRAILQNPRTHTGQRYQQRRHRNNNSNNHQNRNRR